MQQPKIIQEGPSKVNINIFKALENLEDMEKEEVEG